ncbi:MAG: hypothetical protein ACKOBL_03615, partial [Chloroflexota bacterium]
PEIIPYRDEVLADLISIGHGRIPFSGEKFSNSIIHSLFYSINIFIIKNGFSYNLSHRIYIFPEGIP